VSGSGPTPAATGRPAAEALTEVIVRTFRLNGHFLATGELIARPAGLTSARWQVLGAVLREPLSVSEAARAMGLTRQSVQRLGDALVADGMAEYVPNPRHRRAKLLRPTPRGLHAIDALRPLQHAFTDHVAAGFTAEELQQTVAVLDRLLARLEDEPWTPGG
jgi:DNA-binding MarR family transcriptional regulator